MIERYREFPAVPLDDRRWPSRRIARAPLWCSVDLRDGNQALVEPMGPDRKRAMFELLLSLGFTEIEVGFPSASQPDFDFVRELVEQRRIPPGVTIQVLTQARADLIDRTFAAIDGAPCAIVHVYNATSPLFRDVVFGLDSAGVTGVAVEAVRRIKQRAAEVAPRTRVRLEYSPETFTATELDFSKAICEAVMDAWQPTPQDPIVLNLPATVEVATPNVYADQIEWMHRNLRDRDAIVLSLHPHNDRGTAVAATELGLMAGADRVEGTLFGNGERTGNVDLVTLALNLATQGIDPQLDLSDVPRIVRTVEECNRLPVHPRHPYGGELVFTAFSGSHQDAIKKGFAALPQRTDGTWAVPYLPIDPKDIGRSYEAVVRVNSQSGKGGVAYVLHADRGLDLPRGLQVDFSRVIQARAEASGGEVTPAQIRDAFEATYVHAGRLRLAGYVTTNDGVAGTPCTVDATLTDGARSRAVYGDGTGPIDAFVDGLRRAFELDVHVRDFHEHAVRAGEDAAAVAYVEVALGGTSVWGVGIDPNIVTASLAAIVSAVGRGAPSLPFDVTPAPAESTREAIVV
ncbi:MAG TPA: 2-isopropylmalate synthase [Candidatus Elarobacter sp.]|nr:2-isopropylmalate synthase [Candidatus Elarobacter sp.]